MSAPSHAMDKCNLCLDRLNNEKQDRAADQSCSQKAAAGAVMLLFPEVPTTSQGQHQPDEHDGKRQ